MAFRKELCRNFQRGSCQYGERCKFLHVNNQQQQPKNNNPFGFGSQQKQQNQSSSNPFGFGSQSKSSNDFPNKQHQFKPFENKWSRFSPISNAAAAAASPKQPDNQSQAINHKCTDPDSCKLQIAEDFQNEKPLWKLTCYGHSKNGPCDIVGDVSYEELRALAYDEAKRGLSLPTIVEKERNLLNSKLIEFENLLRNPYVTPLMSAPSQSPFPGPTHKAILPSGQTNSPPSVSSFSQLAASLNMASGTRPSTPLNNAFGQATTSNNAFGQATPSNNAFGQATPLNNAFRQANFSNSSQTSNPFGIRPSASSQNAFGQPNGFSNPSQTSSIFGKNNFTPANPGSISSQLPGQASTNVFSSNAPGFNRSSVIINNSNTCPSSALSTHIAHSPAAQPLITSGAPNSASNAFGQAAAHIQSVSDVQRGTVSVDASIWLKEIWTRGEIPEEAPPDQYI